MIKLLQKRKRGNTRSENIRSDDSLPIVTLYYIDTPHYIDTSHYIVVTHYIVT